MIIDGMAEYVGDNVTGLSFSETGGNVFVDALPDAPARAVGVYGNDGDEADSLLPYDAPRVQIMVRSDRDPRWGLNMWQDIYNFIHGKRDVTLPDGTYMVYALVERSGPDHLQPDDQGRHQYGMDIRTEIYNPTSERP